MGSGRTSLGAGELMILKISAVLLIAFSGLLTVSGQSVTVTKREVVYTREKPKAEYRSTFIVTYPKVKAATPALSRRIETAIGFEANNMIDLKEELSGEYQWLESADFGVVFNNRGVLCVSLYVEGTAAHPTGFSRSVVVDLRTGRRAGPKDVFINLPGLARAVKKIQDADIASAIEAIKQETDYGLEKPERLFEFADFKAVHLEGFVVNEKGVVFQYDYGFPYVLRAIEPVGSYFLSWAEIRPFIRRGGLLGRFVN